MVDFVYCIGGFQASKGSESDATRIYAVFNRATVNYWTKDRLDTLKVKYGTEIAEPLIEEWTREYLDVSYVRHRQGVAVNPLSGKVYIYSSPDRKERVETPVKSTRYVYSSCEFLFGRVQFIGKRESRV